MSESSQRIGRKKASANPAERLAIASRVMAALFGGYLVAYASAALLTVVLPMRRIDRVVTADLLSFVIWTAAALAVFAARNAWRSWWPLLLGGGAMLALALTFRDYGMRP